MRITCRVFFVAVLLAIALPAAAQQPLRLEIRDGAVTLHAKNVPLRTILAEWSRVGGTRIVNGDRIPGGPVTLDLEQVPERQAVDILLRNVSGYVLGQRSAGSTGAAQYDRILILATSVAPRGAAAPVAAPIGIPPAVRQPQPAFRQRFDGPPVPVEGLNDEVVNDDPDDGAPPISPNRPLPRRLGPTLNGIQEFAPAQQPEPDTELDTDPQESQDRPIMTTPGNPFGVPAGSSDRPGGVTPVPQPQSNQPRRPQDPD